jgi:hypothetical protein
VCTSIEIDFCCKSIAHAPFPVGRPHGADDGGVVDYDQCRRRSIWRPLTTKIRRNNATDYRSSTALKPGEAPAQAFINSGNKNKRETIETFCVVFNLCYVERSGPMAALTRTVFVQRLLSLSSTTFSSLASLVNQVDQEQR